MAQDPLSHVASWLAPARPDVEDDPIIALIAEQERIRCAAVQLGDAADLLFFALLKAKRRELERMEERRRLGEKGELYPPVRAAL